MRSSPPRLLVVRCISPAVLILRAITVLLEGVIVTKKDHTMTKHPLIEVPNLHVCKLLQSLKSREVVKEKFNWQYLYYTLTDKGIEYLREYLHVPEGVEPATLKKPSKPQPPASFGPGAGRSEDSEGGRGGRGGFRGGRGGYRGT
jgi:small subunit ribosomal protein S10e